MYFVFEVFGETFIPSCLKKAEGEHPANENSNNILNSNYESEEVHHLCRKATIFILIKLFSIMSRHWPFNKMASEKDRHLYSSGLCFISLCKRMCFLRTCIDINWVWDHFLPNDLIFWYRSLFCWRLYFKSWAIIGIGDLKEWFSFIMVRTTAVSTNKRQLIPMLNKIAREALMSRIFGTLYYDIFQWRIETIIVTEIWMRFLCALCQPWR